MWLLVAHVSRLVSAKKTGIWASVYIKVPRSDFAHSFSNINDSNQCNACLRLISEKLRESSTILILRKIDFLKILLTKFLQISSNEFFPCLTVESVQYHPHFYQTRVIGYACHSLTHSLTNWLPFSKFDWPWREKTCWGCYYCWCWWWESCWQQFDANLGAEAW